MIYPKFPKRSLAIIVVCLIVTLAAVGALLLVYLFTAGHSPLVLTDEDGSLVTIASSSVGLFRSSLPILQKDHYSKLQLKPSLTHPTEYKRPESRESDVKNEHYVGDDEDLDTEVGSIDYGENFWGDKTNGKGKILVNRRLDVLERTRSSDYDTEELIEVGDDNVETANKLDDEEEGRSATVQFSKLTKPRIYSNRGDTIYIDDYEHPSRQNGPTGVYQLRQEQHQIPPNSDMGSDLEYFYEFVSIGCSDDDDAFKSKCHKHKTNKKKAGRNPPKLYHGDVSSMPAQKIIDETLFLHLDVIPNYQGHSGTSHGAETSNYGKTENFTKKARASRNGISSASRNEVFNKINTDRKQERPVSSNSRSEYNFNDNLDTLYDNSYGVDNRDDENKDATILNTDIDAEVSSGGGSGSHPIQFDLKQPVDMETRKFIQRINNRMWKIRSNILDSGIGSQGSSSKANQRSKNKNNYIMVRKSKQNNKSKKNAVKFPKLENRNSSLLAKLKGDERTPGSLNASQIMQHFTYTNQSNKSKNGLWPGSAMNVAIEKNNSNEMLIFTGRTNYNKNKKITTGSSAFSPGFNRAPLKAEEKSAAWTETRTRRIIGNVKKIEERSRQLLLCEEAGGGELCRMLFKGHLSE